MFSYMRAKIMKCKQVVQHLKLFQMITDVFCYGFKSFQVMILHLNQFCVCVPKTQFIYSKYTFKTFCIHIYTSLQAFGISKIFHVLCRSLLCSARLYKNTGILQNVIQILTLLLLQSSVSHNLSEIILIC